MILLLTLIWALCSTASALECLTCNDENCSATISKTCTTETMCITSSMRATSSGTTKTTYTKKCASAALCPTVGFHSYAANVGYENFSSNALCCKTDNCNIAFLPVPLFQDDKTIQCHACDSSTSSSCRKTVQCLGAEDMCYMATVTSSSGSREVLGCVSRNLCEAATSHGYLPLMTFDDPISSGPTCCGTSFCTTKTETTMSTITGPNPNAPCVGNGIGGIQAGAVHLLLLLLLCVYTFY